MLRRVEPSQEPDVCLAPTRLCNTPVLVRLHEIRGSRGLLKAVFPSESQRGPSHALNRWSGRILKRTPKTHKGAVSKVTPYNTTPLCVCMNVSQELGLHLAANYASTDCVEQAGSTAFPIMLP